jgi:hypothetical protein
MSITFVCERCGHPIDVDERLAGLHGKCKHCGQPLVVPAEGATHGQSSEPSDVTQPPQAVVAPPLRLRPLEGAEAPRVANHLLAAPSPLNVRPAEAEPTVRPQAVSDPDSDDEVEPESRARRQTRRSRGQRGFQDYNVLDPFHFSETHSSLGPPPLWMLLPTLTARFVASQFRLLRDRLYVVSLFFLVLVLIGFLFKVKLLLHLGALGVIATNIGMLGAGMAYLVTLPFKESLRHGLANLLIPFYAVYYWTTRWSRMRTPVRRTLGSFLPISLVAIAYAVYEEGPAVERAIEKEVPVLEKALEDRVPALDRRVEQVLEPLEKAAPEPRRAP